MEGDQPVVLVLLVLVIAAAAAACLQTFRRRQAGTALEELRQIVAVAGAATWSIDVHTGAFKASPSFSAMLGLDPDTTVLTNEMHERLCHPDDWPAYQSAVKAHSSRFEYRLRHAQGHYVWIHCRGGLVQRPGRKSLSFAGGAADVTDRRAAETELSRSRESLKLAMDSSQTGHFEFDARTGAAFWSSRAQEILGGADATAPTPALLPSLVHPDDLTEFLAECEDLRQHGRPLDIEVRLRHAQGHYVWVHLRATPQPSDSAIAGRLIGLMRDTSQRRRAEQAVVASEKKYRDLIEGSIQSILILDRERPVFCNRACAALLGYDTPAQLIGHGTILPHLTRDNQENFQEIWTALMRGDNDGIVRRRQLIHLTGRAVEVDVVGRRIQWDGGPAWQVTMLDVTARSRMEQQLRASEERFRLLATHASDVILVFDSRGVVTYASPSTEVVSGYAPSEIIGRPAVDIVHDDDRSLFLQWLQDLLDGALKPQDMLRWRVLRRGGGSRWVETTYALLPRRDGGPSDVISASRDISERVQREYDLSVAHARLERQANDLAILAQSLEAERARAEQANAAKSQFLAMMSHELRTPMTGVLGMADILSLTDLNKEQRDLTQMLTRSARILLDLLNDILDFSKIEAGQLQIDSTPFSIAAVVNEVENIFMSPAADKGIALATELPAAYCDRVIGDPKRVRQVLANLVNNAVKFTEQGKVTVGVSQREHGDAIELVFTVADTGIGISQDDVARLFAPFIQADVSTSRRFGGTGLGLAICKRLVTAMGGAIEVQTEPGVGSRFTFSARVRPAPAGVGEPEPQSEADAEAGLPPRRILIAEDNETSRFLIAAMLKRRGHSVAAVENGALALEALKNEHFDVVLMDMQMPVMDGPEATRRVRALDGALGRVPIIALTADVISDHRRLYIEAGVNAVVAKPVDWRALAREIERCARTDVGPPGGGPAEAAPAPCDGIIDDATIAMLVESLGADVLGPMLDSFVENMEQYRTDLHVAATSGDLGKTKRVAHALKGLCAQFGASRAAGVARYIEEQATEIGQVMLRLGILDETVAATAPAFRALKERLAALPGTG